MEHLNIDFIHGRSKRVGESVIGLARALKQLQSFDVTKVVWDVELIINFLLEAENLDQFHCDIDGIRLDVDSVFLNRLKSSENPTAILSQLIEDQVRKIVIFDRF